MKKLLLAATLMVLPFTAMAEEQTVGMSATFMCRVASTVDAHLTRLGYTKGVELDGLNMGTIIIWYGTENGIKSWMLTANTPNGLTCKLDNGYVDLKNPTETTPESSKPKLDEESLKKMMDNAKKDSL